MTGARRAIPLAMVAALLFPVRIGAAPPNVASVGEPPDVVLEALAQELARAHEGLELPGLATPHYMAFWARDQRDVSIQATAGSLMRLADQTNRWARIDLRVGDPAMDNTGFVPQDRSLASSPVTQLPMDDDGDAIRRSLWLPVDRLYKSAAHTLEAKRAFLAKKMGELRAPDFTLHDGVRLLEAPGHVDADPEGWTKRVKGLSAIARRFPRVLDSDVVYFLREHTERFVSTEGSRIRQYGVGEGIEVSARALAADGMELGDFAVVYGHDLERGIEGFAAEVDRMFEQLDRRLAAPRGEDYLGPVLLEDQAACEFLGQLLVPAVAGERVFLYEDDRFGPRQASTLASRLNRRVLPLFLSVVDDPQAREVASVPLLGGYSVDQEGTPPERVSIIDKGILKGLLTTRAPLEKIPFSNGHARAENGLPGGRISNLIVSNTEPHDRKELERHLLELVKAQELPYGIVIRKLNDELLDAQWGGGAPISTPIEIVRLYADGREEEIRGVTWGEIGIRMLRDILAAGDEPYVYNYYQGGRGGTVLVSISSPALLLDEVELKAVDRGEDRPPVLASPLSLAQEVPRSDDGEEP